MVLPLPIQRRLRMSLQAFAKCQGRGDVAEFLRALGGDLDQAAAFLEVIHAERGGEARCA